MEDLRAGQGEGPGCQVWPGTAASGRRQGEMHGAP